MREIFFFTHNLLKELIIFFLDILVFLGFLNKEEIHVKEIITEKITLIIYFFEECKKIIINFKNILDPLSLKYIKFL